MAGNTQAIAQLLQQSLDPRHAKEGASVYTPAHQAAARSFARRFARLPQQTRPSSPPPTSCTSAPSPLSLSILLTIVVQPRAPLSSKRLFRASPLPSSRSSPTSPYSRPRDLPLPCISRTSSDATGLYVAGPHSIKHRSDRFAGCGRQLQAAAR